MKHRRVFITGMGIISPLGHGVAQHVDLLKKNRSGIKPISLFATSPGNSFPAGEIPDFTQTLNVPRTHELALLAAQEALSGTAAAPDSIILGTTTGGMPLTEELLKKNEKDAGQYLHHSTSSVTEFLADVLGCKGLILTITTACSSGSGAASPKNCGSTCGSLSSLPVVKMTARGLSVSDGYGTGVYCHGLWHRPGR